MNKRQRKKREKIIQERLKFINDLWFVEGLDLASGKDKTVIFDEMQDYKKEETLEILDVIREELKQRKSPQTVIIYDELHEYNPGQ